jgi:hypothetical protein
VFKSVFFNGLRMRLFYPKLRLFCGCTGCRQMWVLILDPGCVSLIPVHKDKHTTWPFDFLWSGAISLSGYFLALILFDVAFAEGSQWLLWFSFHMVTSIPWHLQNLGPRKQNHSRAYYTSQLSPALTAKDRQSGQTAPCYSLEKVFVHGAVFA